MLVAGLVDLIRLIAPMLPRMRNCQDLWIEIFS